MHEQAADRWPADDTIQLSDVASFLRRNWKLVAALAAIAALAGLSVLLVMPREWEASVTLVVVPPRFSSDLKPATLTVQGYQALLESDAVVAETKRRLVSQGALRPSDELGVDEEIRTKIFVSRRTEETSLAPMLQAITVADSADQAAAIANTWAGVFLERSRELMAGSTSSTVQFIESQYPVARTRLLELEGRRLNAANEFHARLDEVAVRWERRLTAFKSDSVELVASYAAETRRLNDKLAAERSLELRRSQLESLRTAYAALQQEQARVSALLSQKQLELEAMRKQVERTPQSLTLQKAITDDALWHAATDQTGHAADWQSLQSRTLQTQELNPVYTGLALRLSQVETEVNALIPRAEQLSRELDDIAGRIKSLETALRVDEADLERLKREREAGQTNLQAARESELSVLQRGREQELESIKRERDTRLLQMDRDIEVERGLFSNLAKNYNEGLLAKAEQDVEDVRLAAAAVAPDRPLRRGTAVKTAVAAALGALLGLLVALLREVGARAGIAPRPAQ